MPLTRRSIFDYGSPHEIDQKVTNFVQDKTNHARRSRQNMLHSLNSLFAFSNSSGSSNSRGKPGKIVQRSKLTSVLVLLFATD